MAEAILWASLKTNPANVQPALQALQSENTSPQKRAAAVYALSHIQDAQLAFSLKALFDSIGGPSNKAPHTVLNRRLALLAGVFLRSFPEQFGAVSLFGISPDTLDHLLAANEPDADAHEEKADIFDRAARAFAFAPLMRPLVTDESDDLEQFDATALLGYFEGCPPQTVHLADLGKLSPMLRIAAVRKMKSPEPMMLQAAFMSPHSTVRDLACLVAVQRFDQTTLDKFIASLLNDLNNEMRISGAVLSGMTGLQTELLRKRAKVQSTWRMQKMMQVGLWMQGELPSMNKQVAGLLMRHDLPTSTLLMALLHRKHPAGLDYLLAPREGLAPDFIDLLVHYRWWYVMRHYLPNDAPPLWLWADPALHRFQVDVLRDWYLLHRPELTNNALAR